MKRAQILHFELRILLSEWFLLMKFETTLHDMILRIMTHQLNRRDVTSRNSAIIPVKLRNCSMTVTVYRNRFIRLDFNFPGSELNQNECKNGKIAIRPRTLIKNLCLLSVCRCVCFYEHQAKNTAGT